MRTIAKFLSAAALAGAALFAGLPHAGAALSTPVVSVAETGHYGSCGASPDTCVQHVTVRTTGSGFTAGGYVYVEYQDVTAGTAPFAGAWYTAGTGFCGPECTNYGRIYVSSDLGFDTYHYPCGHTLRAWAWDQAKTGWSYGDTKMVC